MKIRKLEFLWKDEDSNTGNCPSLTKAEGDGQPGYIVNGARIDETMRARIPHAGAGEGAVWVPANVIERIRGL